MSLTTQDPVCVCVACVRDYVNIQWKMSNSRCRFYVDARHYARSELFLFNLGSRSYVPFPIPHDLSSRENCHPHLRQKFSATVPSKSPGREGGRMNWPFPPILGTPRTILILTCQQLRVHLVIFDLKCHADHIIPSEILFAEAFSRLSLSLGLRTPGMAHQKNTLAIQ